MTLTKQDVLFDDLISTLTMVATTLSAEGHRLSKDQYGLALAKAVALRADCTRRRVGAVIIDRQNRVVGTGYNGPPPNKPGCLSDGACPRGTKSLEEVAPNSPYVGVASPCIALHAEENAILHSDRADREGSTIFITDKPCPNCERVLGGSGLARVVYLTGSEDRPGNFAQYAVGA
jgi:dCMP deaminase